MTSNLEMSQRRLAIRLLVLPLCVTVVLSQSERSTQPALLLYGGTAEPDIMNESQLPYHVSYHLSTVSTKEQLPQRTQPQLQSSINLVGSMKLSMISASPSSSSAVIKESRTALLTSTSMQAKKSTFSYDTTPRTFSPMTTVLHDVSISLYYFDKTMTIIDVTPTPSSIFNSLSSIVVTGSQTSTTSTATERGRRMSPLSTLAGAVTTLYVLSTTTSTPITMETVSQTPQTTLSTGDGGTKEMEKNSRPGVPTPTYIGIAVVGVLVLIATALLIFVLFYCFCRRRKYEYNTGNEFRVTVQKWNTFAAHYTANQCDSVSSSRGSSISSLRSSNNKMKPRYGGVSSSADHVHTGAHYEMYSTPL